MTNPEDGAMEPEIRDLLDGVAGVASDTEEERRALARVRRRVMNAVAPDPAGSLLTVPATTAAWESIAHGVERKILWRGGGMQSCLVRMAPGASLAGHDHPSHEECIVLEGALRIGDDILLRKGDYHMAVPGSAHEPTTSECGVLVFLRGATTE